MLDASHGPLLARAAAAAKEVADAHAKRLTAEQAAQKELARLLESKQTDVARCLARAQAAEASAAELHSKQAQLASAGRLDAPASSWVRLVRLLVSAQMHALPGALSDRGVCGFRP